MPTDPAMLDSLNTDNMAGTILPSDSTNYQADLPPTTDAGGGLSLDQIFKYAGDAASLAKQVGIIGQGQASVNPNGTIQPTGLNPVVQTKATTTATSWVSAHPYMTAGIGLAAAGLIYLAVK